MKEKSRKCNSCGHFVSIYYEECPVCHIALSKVVDIFSTRCDICGNDSSREITDKDSRKTENLCYECYLKKTNKFDSQQKYMHKSKIDAIEAHYLWKRQEAIYYGRPTSEIDKLLQICNDFRCGINPKLWNKIGY